MALDHHSHHLEVRHLPFILAVVVFSVVTSCTTPQARRSQGKAAPLYAPEARSDFGMVSTGSVEATRAGVRILEQGGNAIDAAVAAAFALGVSDPVVRVSAA